MYRHFVHRKNTLSLKSSVLVNNGEKPQLIWFWYYYTSIAPGIKYMIFWYLNIQKLISTYTIVDISAENSLLYKKYFTTILQRFRDFSSPYFDFIRKGNE